MTVPALRIAFSIFEAFAQIEQLVEQDLGNLLNQYSTVWKFLLAEK